ncbi:MAG: response regulator [Planctomycetaceae bacterium]|nr:response regulator [Planctomycetaceae bacterium]
MKKMLIVDDSATMRKIIMRVLRQAEIPVSDILEAGNGKEGLQRLVADPDIAMVLSDINMPEMNGIDFLKAIRTRRDKTSLPVVMITTEGGEAMLQTAMDSGANGYVTKPFTPDSIRSALEGLVG